MTASSAAPPPITKIDGVSIRHEVNLCRYCLKPTTNGVLNGKPDFYMPRVHVSTARSRCDLADVAAAQRFARLHAIIQTGCDQEAQAEYAAFMGANPELATAIREGQIKMRAM
jgi:hypothetical protein